MQIRSATPADIPAMMAVEQATPAAAHWSEADYKQVFAGGRIALVAEEDAVAAFVVARDLGPEWEIENVVVAVPFQRKGLGTRLLDEVLDLAVAHDVHKVFLEVRESNTAGRALYRKAGFTESGRRNAYYRDPQEDAVLCKKLLSAPAPKAVEGGWGV